MTCTFDIGDYIRIDATFVSGSSLIDPTVVNLEIREPNGTRTVFVYPATVFKKSLGIFYRDVYMNDAGQWWYRWYASGTIISEEEQYFYVRRTVFP